MQGVNPQLFCVPITTLLESFFLVFIATLLYLCSKTDLSLKSPVYSTKNDIFFLHLFTDLGSLAHHRVEVLC
jgi:hypothetical protein